MNNSNAVGRLFRYLGILFIVLPFLLANDSNGYAADLQANEDVRCMLVGLRMMTLSTPQQRADGAMLAIYYFGRLDGHAPQANVEQLLENEAKKLTMAQLRMDAARCGRTLAEKGRELQRIGAKFSSSQEGGTPK